MINRGKQVVFKAHFKSQPSGRFYCKTAEDCWEAIKKFEAFGLEREYTHDKRRLKKDGWSVHTYVLVEVV